MSSPWVPPRRSYHLRVFAVSLAVVLVCLGGFLFGVRLEAVAPGTGTITARDLQEVRAPLAGLVELGWHEGELPQDDGPPLSVRLDPQGSGITDPERGPARTVAYYELSAGTGRRRVAPDRLHFHRLQAGNELWPGQVIASLSPPEPGCRLDPLDSRPPCGETGPEPASLMDFFRPERDRVPPSPAILRVPDTGRLWLVVSVAAVPQQALQPGDPIATLVPLDPQTRRPRDLVARLEIDEKHWGDVAPGQTVRLSSTMYNPRLHGHAEAVIERLEPWGEPGPNGERRFHAVAPVTEAPFPLWLGSSFRAEVVLGRKRVYRIILEH